MVSAHEPRLCLGPTKQRHGHLLKQTFFSLLLKGNKQSLFISFCKENSMPEGMRRQRNGHVMTPRQLGPCCDQVARGTTVETKSFCSKSTGRILNPNALSTRGRLPSLEKTLYNTFGVIRCDRCFDVTGILSGLTANPVSVFTWSLFINIAQVSATDPHELQHS
jgi:hypothetical protein